MGVNMKRYVPDGDEEKRVGNRQGTNRESDTSSEQKVHPDADQVHDILWTA